MSFLDEKINLRLRREITPEIENIIKKNPFKYDSVSHFIRVAINEKIKAENPAFFEKVNKEIIRDETLKGGQK